MAEGKRTLKLAFFGNPSSFITAILFKELVRILKHRKDLTLAAVVDSSKYELPHGFLNTGFIIYLLRYLVAKFFNPTERIPFNHYRNFLDLASKVLPDELIMVPPSRNINDSNFVNQLKSLGFDIAFSVACPQKFQKELLNIFTYSVNYHNSLLPKYRGTNSTAFSVYYGDKVTGYTFHMIDEKFDSGNILVQGYIPIEHPLKDHGLVVKLEIGKTIEASKRLNEVFDCLVNNKEGVPQKGNGSYFGSKASAELITVSSLTSVEPEEIRRRLILGGHVKAPFQGESVCVTDIRASKGDLIIKRINHLPVWLWRICRRVGLLSGEKL